MNDMTQDEQDELQRYGDQLMEKFRQWPGCPVTIGQFGGFLETKSREIVARRAK